MPQDDTELIRHAKIVFDFNWTGEYTQPGPRLYPHQWSWDSALIAIGYANYDQDRAEKELRHLFEARWKNGMLPQIVFNPKFLGEYFPGASFWHADESPNAPRDSKTSGVVLPPVYATAVQGIHQRSEDKAGEFLEYAFPKLEAWHEYLYQDQDPESEDLVYIRHPWDGQLPDVG